MAAQRPVLLVDDDAALIETLLEHFADDGEFAVTPVGSVQEAKAKLAQEDTRFDAVLLDIGLPGGDGRDLCARLRKEGHQMPIIILTGADGEADVVRGLDAGANDYVTKPFKMA